MLLAVCMCVVCAMCVSPLCVYCVWVGWGERVGMATVMAVFIVPAAVLIGVTAAYIRVVFISPVPLSLLWLAEGEGEGVAADVFALSLAVSQSAYFSFWSIFLTVCWLFGVYIPKSER